MAPWLRRSIPLASIILLCALALFWWNRPKPLSVAVKAAEEGRVESTLANTRAGSIEACQRTRLSTIAGGRIEYLGVKEGDQVRKGQLLLKLWNDDQQAQTHVAGTQLESARRRREEACAVAAIARREAERTGRLAQAGFVSSSKEDSSRSEAEARAASCAAAEADVRQAQARVQASRVDQGRTRLVAPFAGTVAKIVGELGEYSTPSPPGVPTPPAIDLIDTSCVYAKAPMDEVDAPKLKEGQEVRVRLEAFPQRHFAARLQRIAPYVSAQEKQARTVDVEARFLPAEDTRALLVGYSADLEVVLETKAKTLRIPTSALLEGARVLVLRGERLEERRLKTGIANWEYTEILEGLSMGDLVVTSLEREGVKAGALARAEEPKAPSAK